MNRALIVIGILLIAAGLLWKPLSGLPLFRLPGDFVIDRLVLLSPDHDAAHQRPRVAHPVAVPSLSAGQIRPSSRLAARANKVVNVAGR